MAERPNNRVSMGRTHHEPQCRTCPHLKTDPARWGGWCQHPSNRVFAEGWPQGFTPSQGSDGGCDLHPLAHGVGAPPLSMSMFASREDYEKALYDGIKGTNGVPASPNDQPKEPK